jgi:aspartate kinase
MNKGTMLTVEKIGGTSMSALNDVLQNIILYKEDGRELYNRIFVVSAFAGVTNLLLENKKTGAPGVYRKVATNKGFQSALSDLKVKLKELNRKYASLGLNISEADAFIEERVDQAQKYLESLVKVMASGYVNNEDILLAAREILASIGEAHSAFDLVNILKNQGVNATLIDLCGFNDSKAYTITQRIKHAFKHVNLAQTICVATGYTKGTEGIMREFDRGYSEITFSKIALAVNAQEAIIHKEYHLSSADPAIVGVRNCRPVMFTNFDVADQLADIGMEAIHPKAAKPLEISGINLRIKNTFEPKHPGTLITKNYVSPAKRIEVITGSDKLLIIDIYDPLLVGEVGADLKIMSAFAAFGISYIFKTTSANSISLVIWEKDFNKTLIKKLSGEFESVAIEKVAMVCLIGSNIDQPGLLAKATTALAKAEINLLSGGFALRKVNIQFIVPRESFKQAVAILSKTMIGKGNEGG